VDSNGGKNPLHMQSYLSPQSKFGQVAVGAKKGKPIEHCTSEQSQQTNPINWHQTDGRKNHANYMKATRQILELQHATSRKNVTHTRLHTSSSLWVLDAGFQNIRKLPLLASITEELTQRWNTLANCKASKGVCGSQSMLPWSAKLYWQTSCKSCSFCFINSFLSQQFMSRLETFSNQLGKQETLSQVIKPDSITLHVGFELNHWRALSGGNRHCNAQVCCITN